MATITDGTNTITPDLILGWAPGRPTRTVVHPIIGSTVPDVIMRPADVRSGTLELFFTSEAVALAALSLLAGTSVWTVSSPALRFVVTGGDLTLSATGQDLNRWQLNAPYVEQP